MAHFGSSLRRGRDCAAVLLLLGCGEDGTAVRDAEVSEPRRSKARTVTVELFRTTAREVEQAADGSFQERALTDLGGVEVCAIKQRRAFASFQSFVDLDPQPCATSAEGETVLLSNLPTNADLVIAFRKDGYAPSTMTFRTDDNDVAAPAWGSLSNPLLREGALTPWLESEPRPAAGDGIVGIGASAIWAGAALPPATTPRGGAGIVNVTPSEGVRVEIEDAEGRAVREVSTLRERSVWVSLPEGSYAFRFSHPRMNMRAAGVTAQYLIAGLSTDVLDTIEVPVLADHNAGAVLDALCHAPRWNGRLEDLATCTLAP